LRVSRRNLNAALLLFVIAVLLFAAPAEAKKVQTGFLDRTVAVAGTEYKYQVFVPDNWTDKQKWPVILFLHGAGERGDDGLIQTEVGIGTAIRRGRNRVPAIVVMPQCRKDAWWASDAMGDVAMAALAQAQKEFHGDPQRVYLTGLSMGGYGTWYLAGKYPGRFAAIAPICGGILMPDIARQQSPDDTKPYTDASSKIGKDTPTWIFHGGADPVVPPSESQRMAAAMKALGGEVKYTEYPEVGHNSWEKAYAEPELFTWMLSKTTGAKTAK
jgi:predicted peptidase